MKKLSWAVLLLPFVVATVGVAVLYGWVFGVERIIRVFPGIPAMNPVTALLFTLISAVIVLFQVGYVYQKKWPLRLASSLSVLVALAGLLIVIEISFGVELGVDLLLFKEKVLHSLVIPARMAQATAVNFLLLGTTFVFLPWLAKYKRALFFWQLLPITTLIISVLAVFFYVTGSLSILAMPFYFNVAIHTAINFLILSAVVLFIFRDQLATKLWLEDARFFILTLLTAVPLWLYIAIPQLLRLPNNFNVSAQIYSIDNLYDETAQKFSGEILSNTTYALETINVDGTKMDIVSYFDVFRPSGEQIFSVERRYGIDAITRKHITGYGDKDRNGYLFGPPGATKESFTYWHVNYDQPMEMTFEAEEKILGMKVNKYVTEFKVDQTRELDHLPMVGEERGINLDGKLEIWIEPTTGRLIKYQDSATAYYYDLKSGARISPWNKFSNVFSDPSIVEQVNLAEQELQVRYFIAIVVPISIIYVAFCLALLYFFSNFKIISPTVYVPVMLFVSGMLVTLLLWLIVNSSVQQQMQLRFESETRLVEDLLKERLRIYVNLLEGGRGLFIASDEVNRSEWHDYISIIGPEKNYSGIRSLGYARVVKQSELEKFERQVRAEGFSDFKVWPQTQELLKVPVTFIEPFDELNKTVFGFDMYSQSSRKEVVLSASQSGSAALTGRVVPVQEYEDKNKASFVLVVPVSNKNSSEINGYIFSLFQLSDLMKEATFNQVINTRTRIYDTSEQKDLTENNLIYDNDPNVEISKNSSLREVLTLPVYGREWTIEFIADYKFTIGFRQKNYPIIVFLMGTIITTLGSVMVYSLVTSRTNAVALAAKITKFLKERTIDLQKSNAQLESEIRERQMAQEKLEAKTAELERINKVMVGRELKMIELKKQIESTK